MSFGKDAKATSQSVGRKGVRRSGDLVKSLGQGEQYAGEATIVTGLATLQPEIVAAGIGEYVEGTAVRAVGSGIRQIAKTRFLGGSKKDKKKRARREAKGKRNPTDYSGSYGKAGTLDTFGYDV